MQSSVLGIVGETFYNNRLGVLLGEDLKFRPIRNHFIRDPNYLAQLSYAKTTARTTKIVGNGLAVVAYLSTIHGYIKSIEKTGGYPGHETTGKAGLDIGVNTAGIIGGGPDAALNIGWELGRITTENYGYQRWKRKKWLPIRKKVLKY